MALVLAGCVSLAQAEVPEVDDLTQLSLSDLASIEVTSVSKSSETLQRAPASIYVITHEDIERSGSTSIPEVLRLAPNLLVTQTSSSDYVISSRGFGGNPSAQNFSNKLLILIDGRSVYTPLFSGIYANTLDVMLEDVERIEVISGVGATLWGANAMNGVINIITRPSYLTQGAFLDAAAGNQVQAVGGRYGDRINGNSTFRVYGFEFHRGAMQMPDGSTAHDGWSKGQGGFRADWSTEHDSATLQGDFYRGTENVPNNSDSLLLGGNVVARYQHRGSASELQIQGYYDQSEQAGPSGGTAFVVHTFDLSLQQTIEVGELHRLIWGGGERIYSYGITNTAGLLFEPPGHALTLGNLFVQGNAALTRSLSLTLGIKLEDDPFSGWTPLPDARLSWGIDDRTTLWAAASRAIRSPTPFDDEVVEKVGPATYLQANTGFKPEKLRAHEIGYRVQPSAAMTLSASAFYNVYDDLRSIESYSPASFFPLYWGNSLRGDAYGLDAWASWQINDWWRLSPGGAWVRQRLGFKGGAGRVLGVAQAGDDPSSHARLLSSMNLPHRMNLDASVRYVGALPDPMLPHYVELDVRLGWHATEKIDVAVSGTNLLHSRHEELPAPYGEQITRSVLAEARLRF